MGSDKDWAEVYSGYDFSLAVKEDGTLWAWGENSNGIFGDGTETDKNYPIQIEIKAPVEIISAGGRYILALRDEKTDLPVMHKPLQNSYSGRDIEVEFTLPEPAKAGSVQLSFSQGGGVRDPNAPHVLTLEGVYETASRHILTLEGSDLGSATGVASVSSGANDMLVNGAIYIVSVSYSDDKENAVSKDEATGFIYDIEAPSVHAEDVRLNLESTGTATLKLADINSGSTDNVTAAEDLVLSLNKSGFSCAEAGTQQVTLTVTDQAGNTASAEATVTVVDGIIPSVPEGQTFAIDENTPSLTTVGNFAASDNCSVQNFSITSGNTGNAFAIDEAGKITVSTSSALDFEKVQEFSLLIAVSDGAGNIFSETVKVKLNKVKDQAPQLAALAEVNGNELSTIHFTATATDEDNAVSELQYSLESAPAGAVIDANSGVFSWTPTEEQGPASYTFSVEVSDGALSDTKEVTITVDEINLAPVITSTAVNLAKEGEVYTYQLKATDADLPANTLTFQAIEIPSWLSFDAASGILSGTPDKDAKESSLILLQVSDGQEVITQEFTLTAELPTGLFKNTKQPEQVVVFPNPTKGAIEVSSGNETAGGEAGIFLLDLQGKVLVQYQGSYEQGLEKVNAYLQEAEAGVYLLQLKRKENAVTVKVVKK